MSGLCVRPVDSNDSDWIAGFISERWGAEFIVAHHQVYHCRNMPGFIAFVRDEKVGLVTYEITGDDCEIVSLDSLRPCVGIGTGLVEAVKSAAAESGCRRLWLVTTNDNMNALRFYQKRGFKLVKINRDAIEFARKLKPVPAIGSDGIPLQDELELEIVLDNVTEENQNVPVLNGVRPVTNRSTEIFDYCPCCGSRDIYFDHVKSFKCKKCRFTYFHNVAAAVAAVLQYERKILMVTRGQEPQKGKLDLPGGFVDPKETAEECVKREIKEELHIELDELKYLCSCPNIYRYKGVLYNTCDLFFYSKIKAIPAEYNKSEIKELVLFAPSEIPEDEIAFESVKIGLGLFLNNWNSGER